MSRPKKPERNKSGMKSNLNDSDKNDITRDDFVTRRNKDIYFLILIILALIIAL